MVSGYSMNSLIDAKCPPHEPHKCPPSGKCYGQFQYCSARSKKVDYCVDETTSFNKERLLELCQDAVRGKNVTLQVRDPSCNLTSDCLSKFPLLKENAYVDWRRLLQVIRGSGDRAMRSQVETCGDFGVTSADEASWIWPYALGGFFVVIVVVSIIIACCYKKKRRSSAMKDQSDVENALNEAANNNGPPPVNRQLSNSLQDENNEVQGQRSDQQTDSEPLLQCNNTARDQSNHMQYNGHASGGAGQQEEGQHTAAPNTEQPSASSYVHPAELENMRLRNIHISPTQPNDEGQLATNQTPYTNSTVSLYGNSVIYMSNRE